MYSFSESCKCLGLPAPLPGRGCNTLPCPFTPLMNSHCLMHSLYLPLPLVDVFALVDELALDEELPHSFVGSFGGITWPTLPMLSTYCCIDSIFARIFLTRASSGTFSFAYLASQGSQGDRHYRTLYTPRRTVRQLCDTPHRNTYCYETPLRLIKDTPITHNHARCLHIQLYDTPIQLHKRQSSQCVHRLTSSPGSSSLQKSPATRPGPIRKL